MKSFYTADELKELGLRSYGENVLVSRKASLYSPHLIELANDVRIDDFCILSGEIKLGSRVHISAYSALYGNYGIVMEDYTGLSPRSTIFSATDDFSGDYLIGPMVPPESLNLISGMVLIKKYSQVGAGSIIMPGVTIHTGVAVGAMSFVNSSLDEWGIYAGIPAVFIKDRSKAMLKFLQGT